MAARKSQRKRYDPECLGRYDPGELASEDFPYPAVLIVGPRGEGKSVLLRDWLEPLLGGKKPAFEMVVVMSRNRKTLEGYKAWVPPVHTEKSDWVNVQPYSDARVAQLLAWQDALGEEAPRVALVLDDVVSREMRGSREDGLTTAFAMGRHSKVSVWLISQAWTGSVAPPTLVRRNADVVALFRSRDGTERQAIVASVIAGGLTTDDVEESGIRSGGAQKLAELVYQDVCRNHWALVVDQRAPEPGLAGGMVAAYKAKIRG